MDKPAEFTIDARAAGKGDLKLYAQVWPCPILLPPLPWAGALGGQRQMRGRGIQAGSYSITGLILMGP